MGTAFIEGSITGHSSPRWKNPGKKDKKVLNKRLSIARANEVEIFLQEIINRKLSNKGLHMEFALECTKESDFDSISIPSEGLGDTVTLIEGFGDEHADESSMRRTDINLVITHQMEAETGMSVLVVIPEECEEHATDRWAVRLTLSGGAGHLGGGAAFALGEIKNRRTNQVATGSFVGAGIGVGLQSPGADPGWGDWTNFKTDQRITFDNFEGTLARLTAIGAGFLIGFSQAYLSFPMYGANSISVGGFTLGAVGADAGSNVGKWNFSSSPPGPPCVPEHTVPGEEAIPYTYDIQDSLKHSVFFETGSSDISNSQMQQLEEFVDHIVRQL